MGTRQALGRLTQIQFTATWDKEATDFTPWLAEAENLSLLGEVIDAELELEAVEANVGAYRADLLCKDLNRDQWVLIENQIRTTDHTHLGQLITYATGLNAVTLVWIAKEFTDEHRAALDWLNEVTSEHVRFFGLEIQLWRIGDSLPAPRFVIRSQPNDFQKHKAAERTSVESPRKSFNEEYWRGFNEYLKSLNESRFKPKKSSGGDWISWSTGNSYVHYTAKFYRPKRSICVRVSLLGMRAKELYELLEHERALISESLPDLDWALKPENVQSYISLYLERADVQNLDDRPMQYRWMLEQLLRLSETFDPLIRQLPK